MLMMLLTGVFRFAPTKQLCLLMEPMLMIQPKDVYFNVPPSHGHMPKIRREPVSSDVQRSNLGKILPDGVSKIAHPGEPMLTISLPFA